MNIIITVQGPVHSKKSYIVVAIKRFLESFGVKVVTQNFHLQDKLDISDSIIREKIENIEVHILEQDTY
jgi:hypothetical protein